MNGLLFLSALLFVPGHTSTDATTETPGSNITAVNPLASKEPIPAMNDITTHASSGLQSTTTTTTTGTTLTPTSSPTSTTSTSIFLFYKPECRPLYMVSGILIITCIIFLIFILALLYKVCQLSRRLKMLSNSDLINMSESWLGTAESNKNKSATEAKESTMLMADSSQTQDETNNGAIKEDGEKVKEDEQTAEEKEVGGTANSEEASATPVTVAESSSSSKPEEDANKAEEAASSEAKEEPDVEKK